MKFLNLESKGENPFKAGIFVPSLATYIPVSSIFEEISCHLGFPSMVTPVNKQ